MSGDGAQERPAVRTQPVRVTLGVAAGKVVIEGLAPGCLVSLTPNEAIELAAVLTNLALEAKREK